MIISILYAENNSNTIKYLRYKYYCKIKINEIKKDNTLFDSASSFHRVTPIGFEPITVRAEI